MKISVFSRWLVRLPAWIDWVFIGILIAGFIVVCLPLLGLNSLDFDEGFSAYLARFDPLAIAHYTALDVHPPLYYIVLHYWGQIFGTDVAVLRMLSVAWSGVALLFGFLIARLAFGRVSAWIAPILMAVSPLIFHYSQIMRMYTMALAISLAATYILLRLSRSSKSQKRKILWVLYGLLVTAGMWTNYFTALIWVAHFIWLVYEKRQGGARGKKLLKQLFHSGWLKSVSLAVILYIPWMPALIYRFIEVQSSGFWIKPLSMDTLASTVTMAAVYHPAARTTGWYVVAILTLVAAAIIGGVRLHKKLNKDQRQAFHLLAASAGLPILLLIAMSLPPFQSSYVYRYVLTAIGIGTLVIGIIFVKAPFSVWKRALLVWIVFVLGIVGSAQAIRAGNQNLDIGQITMVGQAITDIYKRPGKTAIVVRSAYNYYAASAYEQSDKAKIYFIFNEQLGKIGSTRMLYDHPEARGIQNMSSFLNEHSNVWILSGDQVTANQPPAKGWHRGHSITKYDPESGKPGTYAVEYYR